MPGARSGSHQQAITYFRTTAQSLSTLITGARDLLIDAQGVTFTFFLGFGVSITESHNLTVRGLSIDADLKTRTRPTTRRASLST